MAPKTAVIIDDEPDITTYFETLLTDNGWSVRTANDPNEGIALAQESTSRRDSPGRDDAGARGS